MTSFRAKHHSGFTIIEALMFLAISSALILIITVGQGGITRQSQFRDAVDTLHSKLTRLQEELRSTTNSNSADPNAGQNTDSVVFAKVVEFDYGTSNVNIYECRANRINGPVPPIVGNLNCDASPIQSLEIKWGAKAVDLSVVVPSASPSSEGLDTIMFLRHHKSGELRTIAYNRTAASIALLPAIEAMLTAYYNSPSAPYRELALESSDGQNTALIRVNYDDGLSPGDMSTALNQITKHINN